MIHTYILLFANIFFVIAVVIVYIKRLLTCKTANYLAMKFEHNLITLIFNINGFEFTKAFSKYLLQLCKKRYDINKYFTYYFFKWQDEKLTFMWRHANQKWSVLACIMIRFNTRSLIYRLYNFCLVNVDLNYGQKYD